MRLIVGGAGVAGLAAADAARTAGAEVVVIEARDRVGGRTWTAPLGDGWIDLGAAWVHDPSANPVAGALAAAGVPTRNDGVFHSRMAVWADGWAGAPESTALTAAVEADWDPPQALEALDGDDGFVEGDRLKDQPVAAVVEVANAESDLVDDLGQRRLPREQRAEDRLLRLDVLRRREGGGRHSWAAPASRLSRTPL